MARNDNDINTMKEVREAYLAYMEKMFDHYEAYSKEMFGRDIAQTMVLTPSRLVTDTADGFFTMAEKRGYSYITVNEAQGDEAYKTHEDFAGQGGISWFERWALSKGRQLRDEPKVDAGIDRMWQERKTATPAKEAAPPPPPVEKPNAVPAVKTELPPPPPPPQLRRKKTSRYF